MKIKAFIMACVFFFSVGANTAQASGIPVVDGANLAQNAANFAKEIQNMMQQLDTAKQHVDEQIKQFESLTGSRGLETLLDGTVRNYIPDSWKDAISILEKPTGYGDIAGKAQEIMEKYFSDPEINKALETMTPKDRQKIKEERELLAKSAAFIETTFDEAEERTKAINHLTNKIGDAKDPKAMQELQAMIDAEQGHLQNAQNKLQAMTQRLQYESHISDQQKKEALINSTGDVRNKKWSW